MYGPRLSRNRTEYMNAGLYVFGTVVLVGGFVAELSKEPKSGLVLLLIAVALIMMVNVHDLLAHLAGIDYRLTLMEFDIQLALVEFAVPLLQALASLLFFLGVLFLFIQVFLYIDMFDICSLSIQLECIRDQIYIKTKIIKIIFYGFKFLIAVII